MAKSSSSRPRTHVKDIFTADTSPASNQADGSMLREKAGESASPARSEALGNEATKSDVFFVERSMDDGGAGHVTEAKSRKKRAAPKPPEPTSACSGETASDGVRPPPAAGTSGVPATAGSERKSASDGRHLAGAVGASAASAGQQCRGPGQEWTPRERDTASVERQQQQQRQRQQHAGDAGRPQAVDVDGNTVVCHTTTRPHDDGAPTDRVRTSMDAADAEDNVTGVSVLSDSGTASSSSGYMSDVQDPRRAAAARSQSPVREEAEEGYWEDECVLDFGDEDEEDDDDRQSGRRTLIYKEYTGEDFARYLQDDQESGFDQTPTAPPRKSKCAKRALAQASLGRISDASTTLDSDRKKGFRKRFSQIFTLSKQRQTLLGNSTGKNHIQNFSFADSKMGECIAGDGLDRLDCTMSDIGLHQSCSATDTLAVRSLKRRPDARSRPNRSSSVGDILERSGAGYGVEDFESRRKSQMYDAKPASKSTKKGNIWSKLARSRKKKGQSQYESDNTTDNPLITRDPDNACEDLRL